MVMVSPGRVFLYGATPGNVAAPPPLADTGDLSFAPQRDRPGVPGINNLDDVPLTYREWNFNFRSPDQGFVGNRISLPWVRYDKFVSAWEPANADIYRIQRKGSTGADLRTLIFTCSPNTATIPVGDPIVVWDQTDDATVVQNASHTLSGFALPTRSKLTVSACTASPPYDINGRRIIEVNMGVDLPAIDYSPTFYAGEAGYSKSTMQLRHWSFYRNAATKELRRPLVGFANTIKASLLPSDGWCILGGTRWSPTTWDWSKDWLAFGDSLTRELYTKEQQGLADAFGATDPRRLAVELEHNPVHTWANVSTTAGFRQLLNDVWYPVARAAWGNDRTLIVKGSQSTFNTFLTEFDWRPPVRQNVILGTNKVTDSGIVGTSPLGSLTLANIAESDWICQQMRTKVDVLGYRTGAFVQFSVAGNADTTIKAKKIGRMLTSANNAQLQMWMAGKHGDDPQTTINSSGFFVINGGRVEAFYPEMRPYCSRAGLTIS